ncbi:MAG TPA: phage holin family protein [Polyangiaceae bacterium]|nr:phage holin family protein [Polyangiaceae bacterium]
MSVPEWRPSPLPRPVTPPGTAASASGAHRIGTADPPLQEVLVELWQNVEKLMRQEVALARAELEAKGAKLKAELIASATGALLALASVFARVATVILLLSEVMPPWLAALITSVATAGAAYLLLAKGKPSVADVTPQRTLRSVKKDIQTFREAGQ